MESNGLFAWRESRGITQRRLAQFLGVSRHTVVNWETGVTATLPEDLAARIKALEATHQVQPHRDIEATKPPGPRIIVDVCMPGTVVPLNLPKMEESDWHQCCQQALAGENVWCFDTRDSPPAWVMANHQAMQALREKGTTPEELDDMLYAQPRWRHAPPPRKI